MPPTSAAPQCSRFLAISDLCQDHLAVLADLFHQVLELCRQAGLVNQGYLALGDTIVRANASRHKAIRYERMKGRKPQFANGTSGGMSCRRSCPSGRGDQGGYESFRRPRRPSSRRWRSRPKLRAGSIRGCPMTGRRATSGTLTSASCQDFDDRETGLLPAFSIARVGARSRTQSTSRPVRQTKTGCYGAKLERAWAPQRPLTWVIIHSER